MNLKNTLVCFFLLFFCVIKAQRHYPGGVPGAEAWYMVDHEELGMNYYPNHSMPHIDIIPCYSLDYGKELFNFNHSMYIDPLCLKYTAPLENTTSRNVFFVGEPRQTESNYSHLTTSWSSELSELPEIDSIIRSRFDLANKLSHVDNQISSYESINNANVNFYNWNIYQTDKKFKSYGYKGETDFYIGRGFHVEDMEAEGYAGNFPEFISFPFELSANEKERVASYLALKYGITLQNQSYRNSKNTIFWNSTNNGKFGNRIFGIGRDYISGLNQLQSESVHNKNQIIASVRHLQETNREKQEMEAIEDNHFIVFGDNDRDMRLLEPNNQMVSIVERVWLSQNTGEKSTEIPMFFKVNLIGELAYRLKEDPSLKLWMLHDKYVTNQEVSDFTSDYVEYYEAVDIQDYGYFEYVHFDPDRGIYDQFTFGVGPEMIVQVRFDGECSEKPRGEIVITGGRAPYRIYIEHSFDGQHEFESNENIIPFEFSVGYSYVIKVDDSGGLSQEIFVDEILPPIYFDLGPDQILNAVQTQVSLDATVDDPNATYKWYLNGVLIQHFDPVLVVNQPGKYEAVVTSGNRSCIAEGNVKINYDFRGDAQPGPGPYACEAVNGYINLYLSGGVPPFTTNISGGIPPINQVHNEEEYTFNNIPFGQYNITTTDANGQMFQQQNVVIVDPLEGINSTTILNQLEDLCEFYPSFNGYHCFMYPMEIDASQGVTNTNVSYEWFINGVSTQIYDPIVEVVLDPYHPLGMEPGGLNQLTLKITNLVTGCYYTGEYLLIRYGVVRSIEPNTTFAKNEPSVEVVRENAEEAVPQKLATKVYPNPSDSNTTFYYEISYDDELNGGIAIYNAAGALIQQTTISGKSSYTVPFSLPTSGMYFITTRANGIVVTDKVIIR